METIKISDLIQERNIFYQQLITSLSSKELLPGTTDIKQKITALDEEINRSKANDGWVKDEF